VKTLPIAPTDLLALMCLIGLTVGVALVASLGWALIVLSALVLIYLLLPDQRANP
jgi:hypothetical protein